MDTIDERSIDAEIVRVVVNIATNLGRFEVINRDNLQRILDEQALNLSGVVDDSMLLNAGKLLTAREALVVKVVNFSQKGIPPDDDQDDRSFGEELVLTIIKGIFSKKNQSSVDQYPDNIETQLSVEIENIDIETGEVLYSFYIANSHTGGSQGKSRDRVVKKFHRDAKQELKLLHVLISEVLKIQKNELLLLIGEHVGIVPGTVFEIVKPDNIENINDHEVTIPGETIAYVAASKISAELHNSVILRKWDTLKPGYRAIETLEPVTGYQYNVDYSINGMASSVGIWSNQKILQKNSWAIGLYFSRFIDSYDIDTYGLGLNGQVFHRLSYASHLNFRAKLGLDFDYVWKTDDENRYVNAVGLALFPGINTELFLSKNMDLLLGIGYRVGFTSDWQRPGKAVDEDSEEESTTTPAVWNSEVPILDKSGLFLTVGFRLILF